MWFGAIPRAIAAAGGGGWFGGVQLRRDLDEAHAKKPLEIYTPAAPERWRDSPPPAERWTLSYLTYLMEIGADTNHVPDLVNNRTRTEATNELTRVGATILTDERDFIHAEVHIPILNTGAVITDYFTIYFDSNGKLTSLNTNQRLRGYQYNKWYCAHRRGAEEVARASCETFPVAYPLAGSLVQSTLISSRMNPANGTMFWSACCFGTLESAKNRHWTARRASATILPVMSKAENQSSLTSAASTNRWGIKKRSRVSVRVNSFVFLTSGAEEFGMFGSGVKPGSLGERRSGAEHQEPPNRPTRGTA